jgi:alpha-ketoglutaric semialdehyde dehydrogenase
MLMNGGAETLRKDNFIAGAWVAGARYEENRNPSRPGDVVGEYALADVAQVEAACAVARDALPKWAATGPLQRNEILRRVSTILTEKAQEIGTLLSREEGKTLPEGIGEVRRAAQVWDYFAGEALRNPGESLPGLRPGFSISVDREPVGVVSAITPFNFPIALPSWKIAAALVYGNTVVFKPSELTPGCAWALVEACVEAGLPTGALNLVNGHGLEIGAALIDSADAVTFTGSTPVGRDLLRRAAAGMKKAQVELGGKNPMVIAADADLDQAVTVAIDGAFFSSGQRCTATSRLIVEDKVYDTFVEKLAERANALKVGDALLPETQVGPVISDAQRNRILKYIEIGRNEGAEVVAGGAALERNSGGYFIAPTIFAHATNDMTISREEIFGPVVAVIRAGDFDEAIAIANDTPFGLSSGVCTRDLRAAERFRRASRAGLVMINAPTAGIDFHVPFGGRHLSGFGGTEQGSTAREFFTESKTTYVNHGVV